jgi:hypothetical protein
MTITSEAEPQTGKHVRFDASGFGSASLVAVSACPRSARARFHALWRFER